MTKIFLLLNPNDEKREITKVLTEQDFELMESYGETEDILTQLSNFYPDIILVDSDIENCEYILGQVKSVAKNQNAQIIMILNSKVTNETMNLATGFIQAPLQEEVLLNIINSHLQIKKSLDRLYENNKELSRSLYQLNVLYNTSSQFAGTLKTDKLYEIMTEAMEKTLSFDIASVLLFNTEQKPVFNLNTIHTPSENLIDALKIRAILNFESTDEDKQALKNCAFEDVEVNQKIKQTRSNKVFGLETISYDSLFAPIKVGDEIFGVVELFRLIPFSPEDVTCFQAIAHQVALPLRSAKLYEEISLTNQKLEKLEKLKSEFISIVSHELRTPLAPISNSLEIVLSGQAGPITDDIKNFITMAKRNISRLSGIIEDLLDLSKIQAGKLDFKYKIVNITPSLELLKTTFEQVATEKNIDLILDIKENLPEIYADTRRIEQIFTNLISNSTKFTQENGEIEVSAEIVNDADINYEELISPAIKPSGNYIKVSVSDNGIGMKKEDIPKIFDKFSQIESSLNRNKGGMGLGLSITKQLIDAHLGAIWVESEPNIGSTFNVILPLYNLKKVFEMDFIHALNNNNNVGIIKISSKKDLNVVNSLKEKKLINITPQSKEIMVNKDEYMDYYFFMPVVSFESFDALFNTLNEFCKEITDEENAIILSSAHSTRDKENIQNFIKDLNE